MSGSYDRPDRLPLRRSPAAGGGSTSQAGSGPASYADAYDPVTGGSPAYYATSPAPPTQQPVYGNETPANWEPEPALHAAPRDEHLYADARTGGKPEKHKHAGIVPAGSVTGRSLTLVISIMCFLACLTAGAVFMINKSADGWLKDMASEVTVQVEPRSNADTGKVVTDTVAFLTKEPGVVAVKPLTLEESAALLEPWLGQADVLKSLPVPRLIALEIDRGSPPDLDALRQRLSTQFVGVTLDDHRHWQQQIRTVTRSFALGGLMILLLVAAATIAIIESATRSSMASHRDIVEVLHFVGATDRFIAREFETHFLKLGIKAGLVGALAACVVFLAAPYLVELIGGQTVTAVELRQLVGSGTLELMGYGLMGAVVIIIAALCMITSRLGVYRILNSHI